MTSSTNKKKMTKKNVKHYGMDSHEFSRNQKTKKLLLMVSHELWVQNWKTVFHGNWNNNLEYSLDDNHTANLSFHLSTSTFMQQGP